MTEPTVSNGSIEELRKVIDATRSANSANC